MRDSGLAMGMSVPHPLYSVPRGLYKGWGLGGDQTSRLFHKATPSFQSPLQLKKHSPLIWPP